MAERIDTDICIIGAGSGGLSVAAGAAQMGARVVLIERRMRHVEGVGKVMGGDCLNVGCVPSKALIAAARHARAIAEGARFGVHAAAPTVDFAAVHAHVRATIAGIAPVDSVARFEGLGVRVLEASARFLSPRELVAGNAQVRAKYFVIATGSAPRVPPIAGLDTVPYLTNETLFDLTTCPEHLLILGGGAIGMEMAQAHRRLGARVSVIEAGAALGREDRELADPVLGAMRAEGVDIRERTKVVGVSGRAGAIRLSLEGPEGPQTLEGSHLLVAVGRVPAHGDLDLGKAGVETTERGIRTDERLRTTNRRIFAIGDAAGGLQFTHLAGYHASVVVRNALLRLPTRASEPVPRVTYTDPEIAHVGLTEAEAGERGLKVSVIRSPFAENDRAQAEGRPEGLLKIIADGKGRILGASLVGAGAGDLLLPLVMAVRERKKLTAFTGVIAPYPTRGEIAKRAAGAYYAPVVFGTGFRLAVKTLLRLPG